MSEDTVVKGIVLENHLGCVGDGLCYLHLLSDNQEIRVIYHYGEWPRCLNNETSLQAEKLEEDDEVEVFGEVTGDAELSTCDRLEYYILKLR